MNKFKSDKLPVKIDIYKSAKCGDKYLSVEVGTKLAELELPESLDADLLELSPFKTRLELDPAKEHPALDITDVQSQIKKNGFAVHGAKTIVDIRKK